MGTKTNLLLTGVAVVAIGAYLATGDMIVGGTGDHSAVQTSIAAVENAQQQELFAVRVTPVKAEERSETLTVRGRSEADETVTLSAQTSGLVSDVAVSRGTRVSEGDVVCRIETGSRLARIAQAVAALVQAEEDFTANERLNQSGYVADSRLRALRAQRDAAEANLKDARLDLERTEIRAPFAGQVETLPVKRGQLLAIGDPCATIVSTDPLLFIGQVSERNVAVLEEGMPATVHFVTGEEREAVISFVAESADQATRTFRVEATLDNADGALRAGVTANLDVALPPVAAHFIPGSALTLSAAGQLGVRAVNAADEVVFHPASIIAEDTGGIWVAGLPAELNIITVGQDFVVEGQKVRPVLVTAEAEKQ